MKIATGFLRGRVIESPKNSDTRPTTEMCRQSVFNICQNVLEGAAFLDLFAGSGAMGIEALSRGASSATFVDNHSNCIKCIKSNLAKLELTKASNVLHGDVFEMMIRLGKQGRKYDIIYVDPPYHDKHDKSPSYSLRMVLTYEELAKKNQQLLQPNGILFVEDAIEIDVINNKLSFLTLKSRRRLGKSVLHEFISSNP